MFRLILGLTGTGKTTEIFLRAMDCARQRRRTILLVPEQFSFQAERTVYTTLTGEEALSISVLSFSRKISSGPGEVWRKSASPIPPSWC